MRYSPHLMHTLGNLAIASSSPRVAPITRMVARTVTAPLQDPRDRMDGEEPDTWTIPSELPSWIPNPTLPGWGTPGEQPGGGDYIPPGGVEDGPPQLPGGGLPSLPRYTQADLDAAYERGKASERDNLVRTVALSALVSGVVGIALGAAADRIGF